MKIECSQLDDLLFEGSPRAMETAAQHARHCASCAEALQVWNELSDTARTLGGSWESETLWPRIARALRENRAASPLRPLLRIAATLLLTAGLGGTAWYALRVQTHNAAFDADILRLSALEEADHAEKLHLDAIARLEKLAGPQLAAPDAPLIVSYKEKLMLLDDAIAECQANIDRNRQNAHLRSQLLAMYSEKQQTLEEVLHEETHVSN